MKIWYVYVFSFSYCIIAYLFYLYKFFHYLILIFEKGLEDRPAVASSAHGTTASTSSLTSYEKDVQQSEPSEPSYTDLLPSSFTLLMEKTLAESADSDSNDSSVVPAKIEQELPDYMTIKFPIKNYESEDSLGFWMRNSKRFPKLFKLALTLIAIQASSGESERMFSVSGWHTAGEKNRLCKDQLERKTFLSVNKDLLRCQIFKKLMKTKKVKS